MQDLIINFTPTGMVPTKDMTKHVPISAAEIIEDVHEAYEIGITMVHLHARDENGVPTYKSAIYRDILEGIKKYAPDLVTCCSLSGRNFGAFEQRSEVLELLPDLGSLTLSSLNFPRAASINAPNMIQQLAAKMQELGIKPELEVFDLGMINYAKYLQKKELLNGPHYINIILGNIAGMQTNITTIGAALSQLPENSYWSLGGIGNQQLKANSIAIALGGGVRVGVEDNIYFDKKNTKLATNADLIKRIHELAAVHERAVMKPADLGNKGFYNQQARG